MVGRLTVVGAGLMGSGIAQVSAAAGWDVTLRDVSDEALSRGRSAIEKSLA
ncbi:MAG: 3-hydroxyacyl-CoA dehydrogenase NAD-binding domain-containing protein, partial [Nocardioidaceae bacterium]